MNYGKAFRIIRATFSLQQADISRRLGIGSSHISLIEAGKRQPSKVVIDKLSASLSIPRSLIDLLASEPEDLKQMEESHDMAMLAESLLKLLVGAPDESSQQELPFTLKERSSDE
jgi:transcriptional regulator with XRE-family HTH domain